ncbi:YdbL family protein [Rhizorhabdus sp.]|uniref:YdbL family protein n=1 Tax=Rhizorhabdus sp. TaxID=1968843 RepID=UPI0025EE839D|nr:YdbL family protein [Rhizorhabdus sp.]
MTHILMTAAALAVAGSPARAADPIVEQALSAGTIGEQWDGYLGFVSAPSGDLKSAVDAINIKRRAGYTQIAAARNVTVDQFAQTTACSTLRAVKPGQAYKLKDGGWQRRSGSESITPDYCG